MRILVVISVILMTYFGSDFLLNKKIPEWQSQITEIVGETHDLSFEKVIELHRLSKEKLPPVFPFSRLQNTFYETSLIFEEIDRLKETNFVFSEQNMEISSLRDFFKHLENINRSLEKIDKNINRIPDFLLNADQKTQKKQFLEKLDLARAIIEDSLKFEKIIKKFSEENERVLILLQNQNEPRSTGGFVGSFLLVDFKDAKLFWEFSDIYGFDRRVRLEDQLEAPYSFTICLKKSL